MKVTQSCLTLPESMEYSPWSSLGCDNGMGSLSSPGDLPKRGIKTWPPALQAHSLPAEPQGQLAEAQV